MRIIIAFAVLLLSVPYSFAQPQCDYKIEIVVNGSDFHPSDFKWRMRAVKIEGISTNITGTARIEDSSGNIVKNYKPWTSDSISKQKTSSEYSPNLDEGQYKIISEINVDCDDSNKGNNIDYRIIKISPEPKSEAKPRHEDENIQEVQSKAGMQDSVKSQDHIKIVENPTGPVQAANNSQNESGEFSISLGPQARESDEDTIHLGKKDNQKSDNVPLAAGVVRDDVAYRSSNEKAYNMAILFLLAVSLIFNIVLIWKR